MINYHRIKAFGVELEGGWGYRPPRAVHDGSVCTKAYWDGEIPSPVFYRLRDLKKWFFEYYPDEVNHTCGMHVHVSFWKDIDYMYLMDRRFMGYLTWQLRKWGRDHNITNKSFWRRLDGENDYCQLHWNPDRQVECVGKSGVRYTIVNFPYLLHGTVEVRVLPMFYKPIWGYKAIRFLLQTISQYLWNVHHIDNYKQAPITLKFRDGDVEIKPITRRQPCA